MESSKEKIVRYLQDAHAAEVGIAKMLEGYINDTNDQSIKSVFQSHVTLTHSQAHRLENRLKELGESPSGGKGFFNSMLAKFSEIMHGAHDEYDKTTQNLIKAYAVENLESGMYESLVAYATAVGDTQTATLAQEIQSEDQKTGNEIFPLISQYARTSLNVTAGVTA